VKATANSTRPGGRGGIGAVELIGTANIDGNWYKEVTPPPPFKDPHHMPTPAQAINLGSKSMCMQGGLNVNRSEALNFHVQIISLFPQIV
jgi:hypothetical protein